MEKGVILPADKLVPIPFLKNMGGLVAGISCGSSPGGRDATDWIQGVGARHVRHELNAQTQVWLYKNQAGEFVGFGSLGMASWLVENRPQPVQVLPMIGIFEQYQGLPLPGEGIVKYCHQLLDHLMDEAETRKHISLWVGLSVRRDNAKAISLYERIGFEWLKNDKGLCRMLLWIG